MVFFSKSNKRPNPGGSNSSPQSSPEHSAGKGKRKKKGQPSPNQPTPNMHSDDLPSGSNTPSRPSTAQQQAPADVLARDLATQSPFFTNNPFSALPPVDDDSDQMETAPAVKRPPPIFIKNVKDFKLLCTDISKLAGKGNFTFTNRISDTKVQASTPDAFREIIKYLEACKAEFHTYQPKEDRAFRVVIRNLHPSTPPEDIKEELEEFGFIVRNIYNIKSNRTREGQTIQTALPLFYVDLEPATNVKDIYNITALCYTKIRVESPRPKRELVQCIKCQQYGHTQAYCNYSSRCVKCGGPHRGYECTKPPTEPAKCALCQQDHPASYKGCETYRKILNKVHPTRQAVNQSSKRQPRRERKVSVTRSRDPSQQSAAGRKTRTSSTQRPVAALNSRDYPELPKIDPPTYVNVSSAAAPPKVRASVRTALSHVPQPPINSNITDITDLLHSFLKEIRDLIVPLINLLTATLPALLQNKK